MPPAFLQLLTPASAQRLLADRVREIRVGLGLKQSTIATRAGVALPTLRRFEQTGEVSLKYLTRICHALGRIDEFEKIFQPPVAATMTEFELRLVGPKRKRGSR